MRFGCGFFERETVSPKKLWKSKAGGEEVERVKLKV
jgi:hypothetical protein